MEKYNWLKILNKKIDAGGPFDEIIGAAMREIREWASLRTDGRISVPSEHSVRSEAIDIMESSGAPVIYEYHGDKGILSVCLKNLSVQFDDGLTTVLVKVDREYLGTISNENQKFLDLVLYGYDYVNANKELHDIRNMLYCPSETFTVKKIGQIDIGPAPVKKSEPLFIGVDKGSHEGDKSVISPVPQNVAEDGNYLLF